MEENINKLQIIDNIMNNHILKVIFKNLTKIKTLEMIRYNKNVQNRLNLNINDYKEMAKIEIDLEVTPTIVISKSNIINLYNTANDECYFNIYFKDSKNETKDEFVNNENVKVKLIIDNNIISLCGLFKERDIINKIKFIKFYNPNIIDMSYMFYKCTLLEECDISCIRTKNVKDMRDMFSGCSSLISLDLSNFNTKNVKDMSYMFSGCEFLHELNISKFNTENVNFMNYMFYKCSSLEKLDINNFNTNNVTFMSSMFAECCSLKELNISNFNTNNIKFMGNMFSSCPDELKEKIKKQNKNIKDEAFK